MYYTTYGHFEIYTYVKTYTPFPHDSQINYECPGHHRERGDSETIYYRSSHRLGHFQETSLALFPILNFNKTWLLQTCILGIICLWILLTFGIDMIKSISELRVLKLCQVSLCPKVI